MNVALRVADVVTLSYFVLMAIRALARLMRVREPVVRQHWSQGD